MVADPAHYRSSGYRAITHPKPYALASPNPLYFPVGSDDDRVVAFSRIREARTLAVRRNLRELGELLNAIQYRGESILFSPAVGDPNARRRSGTGRWEYEAFESRQHG